jgi:polysaccharide biosynthesis transport protein
MELNYFLSVLGKRKWLLLFIGFVAAATTAFVVGFLPKKYKSGTVISTGVVDFKGLRVGEDNIFVQEFEIESKFANHIEYMKSRPAINILTNKLILHDLLPSPENVAFRKIDFEKLKLSKTQIDNFVSALQTAPDSIGTSENGLENLHVSRTIEKALGYDYETFREKIEIKRLAKSDYVTVTYASESPRLTYFVVRNFVDEFLEFYYSKKDTSENKSLEFYRHLVYEKKNILDSLNTTQVEYARRNGLVAPLEQAQALVMQIKDLEMVRDEEIKKRAGYMQSLGVYDTNQVAYRKFSEYEYAEAVGDNGSVRALDEEIRALNTKWVDSGLKDEFLKKKIEDLKGRRVFATQRIALSRRDNTDPVITKQNDVFLRRIDAESNYKFSKESVQALNGRIAQLYGQKSALVNDNATWSGLGRQIELAQKEYEYAIEKQNQADVIKQSGETPLKVLEQPLYPYQPESSKRLLLSVFAGVAALSIGTVVLFLLSYFDRSLNSPFQFIKQTNLPLLGSVNMLRAKRYPNLNELFENEGSKKEVAFFKENLRKIRHDIESSGAKSFLFASMKEQEGKSFMAAALAHTLSMKNKRVLIIDTNFKNNTLSSLSSTKGLVFGKPLSMSVQLPNVTIIGNQGGHNSPSELLSGIDFKQKINEFGKNYDYIFFEAAPLNNYSDARELIDFTDKVVVVFDATTNLSNEDSNSLEFLKNLNGKMLGGILNKVDLKNLA